MTLISLQAALLAQGGTLAELVAPSPLNGAEGWGGAEVPGGAVAAPGPDAAAGAPQTSVPHPPHLAASGPRAAGREGEYELLLEMIFEGSLLHYGSPRLVRCADPDLALLLGDQLYALGLSRLADLGDLDAVRELADLISLLAQARAGSDPRLAEAIWAAGAAAIGWGRTAEYEAAKALARAGDRRATEALTRARDAVLERSTAVSM